MSLHSSQYRVLELWQKSYGGELLIMLPDTFGTTQFLQGAPDWVADWTGQRADSKDPVRRRRRVHCAGSSAAAAMRVASDLIASDGLDVDDIIRSARVLQRPHPLQRRLGNVC